MNAFKGLRVLLALAFFVSLLAFFLDFSGTFSTAWHRLAHLQITPAILDVGVGILILWFVVTLILGRVYCSMICPLGIMQDGVSRISGTMVRLFRRGKKGQYRFRTEMKKTRWSLLAVFIVSLFVLPFGVTLLDPYSNFGRIVASLVRPVYLAGNNFLAAMSGETGDAMFRYRAIHVDNHAVFVALAVLVLLTVLSALFGRRYCNTICPVGTLLGGVSKFSLFKVRLKHDCVSCGLCERVCKGECIDSKSKTVDSSRCVACFNCLGACRHNSITYSLSLQKTGESETVAPQTQLNAVVTPNVVSVGERRSFLRWSIFSLFLPSVAGSLGASRSTSPPPDPSLPTGVSRVGYEMTVPILPPGAVSREHFQRRCTGCHLCVSKCPAHIIRPSVTELGLAGFLQPVVKFDYGFCNFNCTICTEICPSHALIPITEKVKHRLQVGTVVFLQENCVVHTQHTNCGACAEHCPTRAVTMVPFGAPEEHLTIPVVDPELCVGCGACEYICPVRPYRAIYVQGAAEHGEAKINYDPDAKQETIELDDFGF